MVVDKILFNKFNFDIWYCGIVFVSILQGFDIGTTLFGLHNKLGYEANENMIAVVNSPILMLIVKSIPVIGLFLVIYSFEHSQELAPYKNSIGGTTLTICILFCLFVAISNTYAIITGINIFPQWLIPPKLW